MCKVKIYVLNRTRQKILHYAGKLMNHRLILLFLQREHLDLALEIVTLKPTSTKKLLDLFPTQQQLSTGKLLSQLGKI